MTTHLQFMHLIILAPGNSLGDRTTSLNTDEENKASLLIDLTKQNIHNNQVVDDVAVGAVDKKIIRKGMINLSQYDSFKLKELQDAK